MEQEYLFTTSEKKYDISKIKPEKVKTKIVDLAQSDCWVLRFTTELENEQGAEVLSKAENKISKYNPIIIKTETSDFYLKKLYRLANEFERKLRKFLYLTNEISPKDKKSDNIKNLELKEFGDLFDVLFTDKNFIEDSKRVAGKLPPNYTKKQLIQQLESMKELCLWDKLVKPDIVPTLRNEFEQIRKFRNDIMHSHNIDTKTYNEADKLFKSVNKELDAANETIVKPESSISTVANKGFSETLENALKISDKFDALSVSLPKFESKIPNIYTAAERYSSMIPELNLSDSIDLSSLATVGSTIPTRDSLSSLSSSFLTDRIVSVPNILNKYALSNGFTLMEGKDNNGQDENADGE